MKRQLQGIAWILFSILLAVTFDILGYNYIFDLDIRWSHLFILLGFLGLVLNYMPRTKVDNVEDEALKEIKQSPTRVLMTPPIKKILAVMVLVITLITSYIVYSQYRQEENIQAFTDLCENLVETHEEHLEHSKDYDFVMAYKIGNAGYGYILNEDLDLIIHPNDALIGINMNDVLPHIFKDATAQLSQGDGQLVLYEYKGREKLTYIYKDTNNMYLCISADVHDDMR